MIIKLSRGGTMQYSKKGVKIEKTKWLFKPLACGEKQADSLLIRLFTKGVIRCTDQLSEKLALLF
jgi:hypothetical protein